MRIANVTGASKNPKADKRAKAAMAIHTPDKKSQRGDPIRRNSMESERPSAARANGLLSVRAAVAAGVATMTESVTSGWLAVGKMRFLA
jgi:hypothetical protein